MNSLKAALRSWPFVPHVERAVVLTTNLVLQLPVTALRHCYLRRVLKWEIGAGSRIDRAVRVLGHRPVTVGRFSLIGSGATLDSRGGLRIGDHVDIAGGVRILTADHDPNSPVFAYRERSVQIDDRCWLATASIVLPGSTVGPGALIAAGAVARGHLEGDSVYGGNPAALMRARDGKAQSLYRLSSPGD